MKKITKDVVIATMNLLILTNGQTTTLEVKLHLRDLGYTLTQKEVSDMMSEIQKHSDNLSYTENGTYRTYTISETLNEDNDGDEDYDDEDNDYGEDYDDEDYDEEDYDEDDLETVELTEDDFTEIITSGIFSDMLNTIKQARESESEVLNKQNSDIKNSIDNLIKILITIKLLYQKILIK